MIDWKKTVVPPSVTIFEAMGMIQDGGTRMVMVVDENNRLLGVVTDGDTRRALLKGLPLTTSVKSIMNTNPIVVRVGDSADVIIALMIKNDNPQIPVLDADGRLVHVEFLHHLLQRRRCDIPVIVMAGGLGTRLMPLTENCPKPMLRIGKKPLLEIILDNFIAQGFHRFTFSVNHMAEKIESHFEDGRKWGVSIGYVRETKKLGTAGALSLLTERPQSPFLVVNGDIITDINYKHVLEFHQRNEAAGTMCVREYSFQVPYGVVESNEGSLLEIKEKPSYTYSINAGMYVLSPNILDLIPYNVYYDMPTLFTRMKELQQKVMVYPVTGLWLDIGNKKVLQEAEAIMAEDLIV